MLIDFKSTPKNWKKSTVAECCDILDSMRIPVNSDDRQNRKGDIPYYGANGQQGWIDDYIFDEELVLIAEDGGNFDEYSTRPIAYRIQGKSWVNNHAHILRAKECTLNAWIFYNLVHRDIRQYIRGSTRAKLNQAELREIAIFLPPLPEQHRIAEILDTADEAIRQSDALIAKLKQVRAGLLHDLLTCGLDEQGRLRDPLRQPGEFKETVLGRIPRGWSIQELSLVSLKIQDGTHFSPKSTEGPSRYVTSKNIRFGYIDLQDCGWISSEEHEQIYKRCDVRYGDVLITKDGANTGNAALNTLEEPFSLLSSVAMIRANPEILLPDFVLHYILSPVGQIRLTDLMTGLAIQRLTLVKIKSFLLPIPPIGEQRRICAVLNANDARIRSEEVALAKLRQVKQGLMADLLSGRVRVNNV